MIRKKAKIDSLGSARIRNDSQSFLKAKVDPLRSASKATMQIKATLAKGHTRSPAIPRGLPRRSQTEVGEDPLANSLEFNQ